MITNHDENKNNKSSFRLSKRLYLIDFERYSSWSSNELWENKKNRREFLSWIFIFTLILVAIWSVVMTQIITLSVDKDNIFNRYHQILPKLTWDGFNVWWRRELVLISISFALLTVILYSTITSIVNCFRFKKFRYISMLPTIFFFIESIYAIISIIIRASSGDDITKEFDVSWIFAADFAFMIAYPCIWFLVSRNVSLIRNIAFQLEMKEKLMEQGILQNDLGSTNKDKQNDNYINTNDAFYIRMKSLSRDQINEIAKTLSISGYENMSDDELIKIIYDIRNVQNKESVEKEAQILNDSNEEEENE